MRRRGITVVVAAAGALLCAASLASASTIKVTRVADPEPNGCGQDGCTLREAVIRANVQAGPDVVELRAGKTYLLDGGSSDENESADGDLDVTGTTTIRSSNPGNRVTVDAQGIDRVFHTFAATTFLGVRITGGIALPGADGGGIFAAKDITLIRSQVVGNDAPDDGQGIASEGSGSVALIQTAVTNNLGQGVRQEGDGAVRLVRSRVTGNDELGVQDSGLGGVTLVRSKVNDNGGGGINELDDGAVALSGSEVNDNALGGVSESDGGNLRATRSEANGNESGGGLSEFDAGNLLAIRAQANDNANNGMFEAGTGSLVAERSTANANPNNGVLELDSGALRASRSRMIGNANNNLIELDDGDLVASRVRSSGSGNAGLFEADGGDLRVSRAQVRGSGSVGVSEHAEGKLTVANSKVSGSGNSGIATDGGDGAARISSSTVTGNTGSSGGGISFFGTDDMRVTGSTVSNNMAAESGGGIYTGAESGSLLVVVNSTVHGNRANNNGGGIYVDSVGTARLNNVTIARNKSNFDEGLVGAGGGIGVSPAITAEASVANSLIALNDQLLGDADDCSGVFDSLKGNVLTDTTDCDGFDGPGDRVKPNPKIGPLKNNGGPTETVALKPGSPAIGAARKQTAEKRDQRGRKRDSNPDAGAFER